MFIVSFLESLLVKIVSLNVSCHLRAKLEQISTTTNCCLSVHVSGVINLTLAHVIIKYIKSHKKQREKARKKAATVRVGKLGSLSLSKSAMQ